MDVRRWVWGAGRAAQITALVLMPAAIWAGEIRKSEREAIGIFVFSILLFAAGFFLARLVWPKGP